MQLSAQLVNSAHVSNVALSLRLLTAELFEHLRKLVTGDYFNLWQYVVLCAELNHLLHPLHASSLVVQQYNSKCGSVQQLHDE
jgi:hypothetical protein